MTRVDGPCIGVVRSTRGGLECHDVILVTDDLGLDSKEAEKGPEPAPVLGTGSGCEAEEKEDYYSKDRV